MTAQKPAVAGEKSAAVQNSSAPSDQFAGKAGRVIHDARGNAVWDWVKETSRIAIDSTSRLLKRLEVPELKVEDTQPNAELSLESDRDAGGGYDPYGGSTPGKGGSSRGPQRSAGNDPYGGSTPTKAGLPRSSAKSGATNTGGGYDPYGNSATRKPSGRKP